MTLNNTIRNLALAAFAVMSNLVGAEIMDIKAIIENAGPGSVIAIPAGVYTCDAIVVPAGVHVCGSGVGESVIQSSGDVAFLIQEDQVELCGFTLIGARSAGIRIDHANDVRIQNLEVRDSLSGIQMSNSKNVTMQNILLHRNRTGTVWRNNHNSALINASLVHNFVSALALDGNHNCVIFNTLFAGSANAVLLHADNPGLRMDYNFFSSGNNIGKASGKLPWKSIFSWNKNTGLDQHSTVGNIRFVDEAAADYRVENAISFYAGWKANSESGVAQFAGFDAPQMDLYGQIRSGTRDIGACDSPRQNVIPDGWFEITMDDGVKSAAVYDSDGIQLAQLFQNLPLAKGHYPFSLPNRTDQNECFEVGELHLKLTESALENRYIGLMGSASRSSAPEDSCSWPEEFVAFGSDGEIFIAQDAFENGKSLRAFDRDYFTAKWQIHGSGNHAGLAIHAGMLYYAIYDKNARIHMMGKVEADSGTRIPFQDGKFNAILTSEVFEECISGMAALQDWLFFGDAATQSIMWSSNALIEPEIFLKDVDVLDLAADEHFLWILTGDGIILSVEPQSRTISEVGEFPGATKLAANGGYIAVLVRSTGKIHLLRSGSDGSSVEHIRVLGKEGGASGPIQADRFWFQAPKRTFEWNWDFNSDFFKHGIAVDSEGRLLVIDGPRVLLFDAAGQCQKAGFGIWGQHHLPARFHGDADLRVWSYDGRYNFTIDVTSNTWMPGSFYELPDYYYHIRPHRAFFSLEGRNFGVYAIDVLAPDFEKNEVLQIRDFPQDQRSMAFLLLEFTDNSAIPIELYVHDRTEQKLYFYRDDNQDGMIDGSETPRVILSASGEKLHFPRTRYDGGIANLDGALIFTIPGESSCAQIVYPVCDAEGILPIYRFGDSQFISCENTFISPYDFTTSENAKDMFYLAPMREDAWAAAVNLKSSGGTGLANGAGTDLIGLTGEGRVKWFFPMADMKGTEGVHTIPEYQLVLGMTTEMCDYMVCDENGLGMGVLAMSPESNWSGMWSDHAQQQFAWVGKDGKPYYYVTDYVANGAHVFAIENTEQTRHHDDTFSLSAEREEALRLSLPRTQKQYTLEIQPQVTIPRLNKEWKFDEDRVDWSSLPVTALITPESASPGISGVEDCSAVVRLAYYDRILYARIVVFDDVVSFHQPFANMYRQDGIEMALNGFFEGFKFNISKTIDTADTVFRDKFGAPEHSICFPNQEVPRRITVLKASEFIEERRWLEALYPVDLSLSPAIVYEFQLPLTAEIAFRGQASMTPQELSGSGFYLGFMVNDNDQEGSSVQEYLVWPSEYGNFKPKESGIFVKFE